MVPSTWVLVHSPLVGPSTWAGVADALRTSDPARRVIVPDLRPAIGHGPPFYPGLVSAVAATVAADVSPGAARPIVLVGHSRAGPILPATAVAIGQRTEALLYVDSRLPVAGHSWFDDAPQALADQLRATVADGLVPPWHEWFGPSTLATLVPHPQSRARFLAEVPRLPIGYFGEPLAGAAWRGPSGYLQLSPAYADASAQARALGWTVAELPTHHLAPLTSPGIVAEALLALHGLMVAGH
jgi:hypothetical protein